MPFRLRRFLLACLLTSAMQLGSFLFAQSSEEINWQSSPIEFEPNRGQAPSDAKYLARAQNLSFTLRESGIGLSFSGKNGDRRQLGLTFTDANPAVEFRPSGATGGESNYLIGSNAANWHTHIPHFERVTYTHLYPGIDLVFYGTGPRLEHDFIVAPGADPNAIRIRVDGNGAYPTLNAAGDLTIDSADDVVVMQRPEIYQMEGGQKRHVEGHFALIGKNEVGFQIDEYDRSRALIIDPTLAVSTYLADTSAPVAGIATDAAGNTYVTGLTFSTAYPVTAGSFQTTCASCASDTPDVFITKLNPGGHSQAFSTFLGGNNYDQPFAIAVDKSGNVIVAGRTQSTDFPTKNSIAHGPAGYGVTFGFISSLTPNGTSLNYSSLLGGPGGQGSNAIVTALAVDRDGSAYITGQTNSDQFPVTAIDCCSSLYSGFVVFVTKVLSTGALGYSSLIGDAAPQNGGGGLIGATGLQVDAAGNAYAVGQAGTLWPITANAYQKQQQGEAPYAAPYISKLDPTGATLLYSTFLGNGAVNGIAVDSAGNAWVTGTPGGPGFPTTANAYQQAPANGCCTPFFSKLSADGSSLLYSSFFYGSPNFYGFSTPGGIALDASQNVWLAGTTGDPQWPLFQPIQGIPGESANYAAPNGFVARFSPSGTRLNFSTFFGSSKGGTQISGIAIDGGGKVHIAGFASDGLYTTPGAFVPAVSSNNYNYGFAAVINPHANSSTVCIAYPDDQGQNFGAVAVGHSAGRTLTITNCGTAPLTVNSFKSSGPEFAVPHSTDTCTTATVAINSSCTFVLKFKPTSAVNYSETLTIASNASEPTSILAISGTGGVPQIQLFQTSVVFDPAFIGQSSPTRFISLTNAGLVPLVIDFANTQITGDFSYTQSGCKLHLVQTQTCYFFVTFTPTASGLRTGQLSIASNDPATPVVTIALSGTGYSSYPVPAITGVNDPTIPIGSSAVDVLIQGTNFFPDSVAQINGMNQKTTYFNSSALQVSVSPYFLTSMRDIQLLVVNPTPGGGTSNPATLTVYRSISIEASGLVYDPVSQSLFAAIPASASANPNTIVPVNPATGALGTPIPVGNDPQRFAVSGDGKYLYVVLDGDHAIQRINLKTRSVERTFALPVDSSYGPTRALYVSVVPGASQFLVAALFRTSGEDGIALFNDQGLVNWLPYEYPAYTTVDSFAFAGTPPVVYAVPFTVSGVLQSYSVNSSGISSVVGGGFGQYENALIASDGKLIYVADGTVWDPVTGKKVAAYSPALFFAAGIIPMTSRARTYFLNQSGSPLTVDSYDQNTGTLAGSLAFPGLYGGDVFGFSRWGTNGFAFQVGPYGGNQLIIFKTTI